MSGTVGDKIGFTAPSDGGDENLWGGILNTLLTLLDEITYAAREDRNMFATGGTSLSYSSSGDITFSSDINFYNSITSYKNIITTAASPCNLAATDDIAYFQLSRKPVSDNSITSLTTGSLGTLPNGSTDADMGTFLFAYRTAENTVVFPWAKREMIPGDVWTPGTQQSLYDRAASKGRPAFRSNPSDSSQAIVPAAASTPAVVMIDGKIYANVADETLDLDTAGRGGLDTGAKAANTCYYVYAIPATTGRTFDVVCSVTPPTTGPTGFASWSYLGSFSTIAASAIPNFHYLNGVYIGNVEVQTNTLASVTRTIKTYSQMSTIAKRALFQCTASGTTPGSLKMSGIDNTEDGLAVNLQVNGVSNAIWGWVQIFTSQTVWFTCNNAANTLSGELYGWEEDVTAYK